ncbi:Vacuolar fusion protein MON1 [Spathaspora sp. JA1]|nr:Vacuolar fusion protein MON1 [Spathaspora sp. JA1]
MSNGKRRQGSITSIFTPIAEPTTALSVPNIEPIITTSESIYAPSIILQPGEELDDSEQEPDSEPLEQFSFLDLNVFSNPDALTESDYYTRYISISKDDAFFHDKLKHFFILSNAGKPIYSMNGSDDIIIGNMAVLTTIISTFEENMSQELNCINIGDMNMIVLNKSPILLVSISKLSYETTQQISYQLNMIYSYLLSVISQPIITRNFHNKLNYDLRRILTPTDFENLDWLCMNMTFGIQFENYISHLLNSCLQNLRLSYTTRQKLNKVLVNETNSDLLFSILSFHGKIISFIKHYNNHTLTNQDLSLLFSMVNTSQSLDKDLWFPICMPNFNPNGFLYVYVKTTNLLTVILLSSNKNSFYQIQNIALTILDKLPTKKLPNQLKYSGYFPILKQVPIFHFIYKHKQLDQFIMNKTTEENNLSLSYFYNVLYHTQASKMNKKNLNIKKFTYCNWKLNNGISITGLMLSNDKYEFYCLCNYQINSKQMIQYSLTVIKWCQSNHNRLFIK